MADLILEVYEVWDPGRSFREVTNVETQGPPQVSSQVDRYFYVRTAADTVDQTAVREAADPNTGVRIPNAGEAHPNNQFLFALDFSARAIGQTHWIVTVNYVSVGATFNPEDEPPDITYQDVDWNPPIDQDDDGNPLTNAAGEPYDPPVIGEFSDGVITYAQNTLNFNTDSFWPFRNAINSSTWRGMPKYTAKIKGFQAQLRRRGNLAYFRVTVTVLVRSYIRTGQDGTVKQLGWIRLMENKGFNRRHQMPDGTYELVNCFDEKGKRGPLYLSADGKQWILDPVSEQANIRPREHRINPLKNFSDLNVLLPGFAP